MILVDTGPLLALFDPRDPDLGEGGYGAAPARQTQEAIKNELRNQRKQRDTG